MLRPIMTVLVGTALLFACGGRDEDVQAEASGEEAIDTAAMIAEGEMSGRDQPKQEDPNVVPIEVSYAAQLLLPGDPEALGIKLPRRGEYHAAGKGICRIDEADGTFQVMMTEMTSGNLQSFEATRWRPRGKPLATSMRTVSGETGIFLVANDGSEEYRDKADMTARRAGQGGTLQFDAETQLKAYSIKGTAKCARLSPPIQ